MDIERLAGTKLGNYEIETLLGRGGMGVVYKARQVNLDRTVALKILPPDFGSEPSFVKRFEREARAVAKFNHPNIVQIYDISEDRGLYFFSMEYVEGQTLDELLKKKTVLSADEAIRIITEVALALEHAHQRKITHRDIKPANIFLDSKGNVKVMDFGLATVADARSKLTRPGMLVGTVAYMSPEQCQGEELDHRTDIYSLGVVLYEMLTGVTPFTADTTVGLIYKIVYEGPVEVSSLNPDVPSGLYTILSRAMAKKKDARYASISQFLTDISTFKALQVGEKLPEKRPTGTRLIPMPALGEKVMPLVGERTPFVGRKSERAELHRFLGRASLGQGSLVMIGGEAGVGKTRLTDEIMTDALAEGFLCLVGHCYEMQGGQPYMPFVEIVESAARMVKSKTFLEMLGESAPEVAKLVPDLRRKFPNKIPPPAELPPEQEQRYIFNGVVDFLERFAQAQPLLLVLEDLHWAGESTALLVQHIARHLGRMPILLIVTYRDTELAVSLPLAGLMANLLRQHLGRNIALRNFLEAEVADMLQRWSGQEPPVSLVKLILDLTEGNAFLVEETVKHLADQEKLFDQEGQWRTDLSLDEADTPRGVRLVLRHRIQRVSKQCLETLTAAAAVGRVVGSKLLEQLVDVDEDTFLDSVEEAERAQLVKSTTQTEDVKFIFSHELIRQALVSDISVLRRQRLHLRVAETIEKLHADRLNEYAAQLAYHLKKAGALADPQKTVHYLRLAGERVYGMGALTEAIEFYKNALSYSIADEIQAEIRCKLGSALNALGRTDEALNEWRTALTLYEQLNKPEEVGNACSEIAPRLLWASRFQEALEISNRGLAALGDRINAARCVLLAAAAHVLAYVPAVGYELPNTMFAEALGMAEKLGEKQLEGPILYRKAMFHRNYWQGPEETECALRSAELLRAGNKPLDTSNALLAAEWGLIGIGRLEEAARVERELEAFTPKTGAEFNRCVLDLYECLREVVGTGDLERLETRISTALKESLSLQWSWIYMDYVLLGWAQFWRGKWELAEKNFRKAVELMDPRAEGFIGYLISPLLVFLASAGRRDEALALMEERKNLLPSAGQPNTLGAWTMLVGAVEALAILGKDDEAARLYPLAREAVATGNLLSPSCASLVQTIAGIAASAAREWDSAEEHFGIALKQAHELPHVIEQAGVRRWHAHMLVERGGRGDLDKALKLLREATELYQKLEMPKHMGMAQGLMEKIESMKDSQPG
ncbi:MAG: hypothetical protein C4532_11680 [Candidatus Abyssobacteria bacterium SURF_17]|uniref:non-specific serine/threonine protein kinase n=1 Tax=Candidatus Abyssobacteria bacterium SURF_17 TaxID=2093361 RepID=A0A419EWG9_9BACT|nr:MAG: hypothetical protein C4532_11680 [Candidatus Abyssubacteria bacterium SURF_17]